MAEPHAVDSMLTSAIPSAAHSRATTPAALADTALRVLAGLLLVPHGAALLFGVGGSDWRAAGPLFEQTFGLYPGAGWALAAGLIEVVGGLLFAAGAFTRITGLAIVALLTVAAVVLPGNAWFWHLGGVEYHLLWAAVVGLYTVKGAGPWSWDARRERRS